MGAVEKKRDLKRTYMKKAVAYKKQYKAEAAHLQSMRKTGLAKGNVFSEPEAKVAFVIRIRGINDVVNQLFTGGDHFSAVAHSAWPFKLSTPNGGLKYKNSHFVEGGDFGNRENLINALVARMC